jgi:hypothetical protein
MLPGLGFWDTGELQAVAPLLGTAHPTGFPTYVVLGWMANLVLTPFGEPAFRMNLFAGLCLAVGAGLTVDLVRALTRSAAIGVGAGVGLALTEIVWAVGTHAEAHALHLALLVVVVRILVAWEDRVAAEAPTSDRWLVGAAIAYGLAMGNHSLTLLLAPAVALFVLIVDPTLLRRPRAVAVATGALVLTVVAVYLELPLRAGPFRAPLVYGHPETWDGFWYVVLAEQFRGSVVAPFADLGPKGAVLVARTVAAFGPLAVLLPLGFAVTVLRRPRYALLSGAATLVTCFFAASYVNADIDRYYVGPAFLAWTWLAMLASVLATALAPSFAGPGDRGGRTTAVAGLAMALTAAMLVPTGASLVDRFARVDRSRERAAQRWVDRALERMERDAVVVSWWSYSTPLWYAQHVEGRRPDIAIIDDRTRLDEQLGGLTDVIDANLPGRPVYVIRVDATEIAALDERYVLEPLDGASAASLTRVVSRRAATR